MQAVWVFRHTPDESLGTLAHALAAAGIEARYVTLSAEPFPRFEATAAAGLVVLGGPMNVDETEQHPFLREEPQWIARAVAAGWPVLGICLGAQLLAMSQGATVRHHHEQEIGWYSVELTPEGQADPLLGTAAPEQTVFQWHGDTFALPAGAVRLARGPGCVEQAFRWGPRAYGLQFHLEVTTEIIDRWLDEVDERCEPQHAAGAESRGQGNASNATAGGAIDIARIRARSQVALPRMQVWAAGVFTRFAKWCVEKS